MRKLLGLQYLRALAAGVVVVFHAAGKAGMAFPIGTAGVDVFFVVSGFIMVAITGATTTPRGFIADRLRRIVPIYWIATAVTALAALAGMFPNMRLTAWHVAASFLFIPAVSPSNSMVWPVVVPGWTLNYEIMFYLIFGTTLLVRRNLQMIVLTVIFGGLATAGLLLPLHGTLATFYTNPIILDFLAGSWLGRAWQHETGWPLRVGPVSFGPALLGTSVTLFIIAGWSGIETPRLLVYGVPALLAVAGTLVIERRSRERPQWTILEELGNASYSIYLWHGLAISVAAKLADKAGAPPVAVLIGGTLTGLAGGYGAYRLIEQPIIGFFKRTRSSRLAATSA